MGPPDTRGRSPEEAKDSRQKGSGQSSGGAFCRSHQGRGRPKERRRRARQPPSRERGGDKAESCLAKEHQARDCLHRRPRVKDRRPQPRSPWRRVKRSLSPSGDSHTAAPPHRSAKRLRQHSPEALSARALSPLSRVMTRMGALEVALEELQAPGGAFLQNVPWSSPSTECTVSQRAWLTWQLAHAGAALNWALHTVNHILAAQAWLPRSSQVHTDSSLARGQCPPTRRFPGNLDCGKKA
ncbi:uncharacterized protein LOC119087402 [Peromyscus leucopus]|uniref:uncharacterized protein LOC119087402 n=1 Tax=Peromyscus leucopus TaxID=10041 RepID=UPI00188520FC|nr:uncharacterized protein LOC119087402 [Peromyscus leucopus]